jgi:UDP-N-acetylglucosamine--N-acetylmuramyl-(pentapeptide) pyrophosphoryl-undecaprenol N-acetylglucosamine transferase
MARIIIAGGGTAGHIEPGLAVARLWRDKNPDDHIAFLGTKSGLENTLVPAAGFELLLIPKVVAPRKISPAALRAPFTFISALVQARNHIKGSHVVIGFGGYVSAPAYCAAKLSGIPIVIHESNAKPGVANRLGAFLGASVAISRSVESGKFSDALITGLPLRSEIIEAFNSAQKDWTKARHQAKIDLGCDPSKKLILIMGGSQGSIALNKVVADSLEYLLHQGYSVIHSVGRGNNLPDKRDGYFPTPYVTSMSSAYLAADLIIARSGAVTCSEFRTLGRYALFVPLPIGNGEQRLNALDLVEAGRAQLVQQSDFDAHYVQANIKTLIEQSGKTNIEGDSTELLAAEKIVNLIEYVSLGKK